MNIWPKIEHSNNATKKLESITYQSAVLPRSTCYFASYHYVVKHQETDGSSGLSSTLFHFSVKKKSKVDHETIKLHGKIDQFCRNRKVFWKKLDNKNNKPAKQKQKQKWSNASAHRGLKAKSHFSKRNLSAGENAPDAH